MEFKDVLYARHSVREFCPDAVPEDTLREIVCEAGRVPSWENSQPWKVYIAYGESLKTIRRIFSDRADSKVKGNPDMPTSTALTSAGSRRKIWPNSTGNLLTARRIRN